jgi:mono/diheme cytochrome c family protein
MKPVFLSLIALAAAAQQPAAQQASPSQPLIQVRGNEGAGSTIFGNACGGCHGKIESAPPPAMLKKLTPEKIYEALTTGDMRNQAKDLTDQQKRDIYRRMGFRKVVGLCRQRRHQGHVEPLRQ